MEIEKEIKSLAPNLANEIKKAASRSNNEADLRTKITQLIENLAYKLHLNLNLREEYTLINGRADAVYNRLIIEYEHPKTLHENNSNRTNQHAINQIKTYINGLVRRERHKPERLAGVVLDGSYFIFVRHKEETWYIDSPLRVDNYSSEYFLKLLTSLSTELALIPENLIRDFGENTAVSRKVVGNIFNALLKTSNLKVKALYDQWSLQFSEVCDYEEASKLKVESFARKFGIISYKIDPFQFFFCLHAYYAAFIKLLAVQVVQYYAMPKLGTNLKQTAVFGSSELQSYLKKMEDGGIFKELGISNFIEGDFFGWYLDVWDDNIYEGFRTLISTLANYSLVTLDIDPDSTRDLLKKLYQQLMPRELRHNLGEYYTPDWLAERVLNMLEGGKFKGDPKKRLLDPACGSGTFLVIVIKKIREYAWKNAIPESQALEKILSNVVGFDLNPLAVISARTNYLLSLGDLLQHRLGEINIPVYLCDSIMTPKEGEDLFGKGIVKFNTTVGPFSLPKSLVHANYIDVLADFLEDAVRIDFGKDQFIDKLCEKLPLNRSQDEKDVNIVYDLYEKLANLERQGINGIWARIIKNAFAPLFAGEFDYVAGNPPWINWEHLPENYRKDIAPLWSSLYGLFPHKGFEAILGKAKDDISVLMTYVSLDKYLKKKGTLGFVITQSVFKTGGGGKGFRKFTLPDNTPIKVLHVDDMAELKPFEGASNRTSIVILRKGKKTQYIEKTKSGYINYLLPYNYWGKTVKGKSIPLDSTLEEVLKITEIKQFYAVPVDENDLTSSWITGRPKALTAVRKVIGKSDYVAHAGLYSGGANAVYWVDIVDKRPDGLVIISNITEGAKKEVESIQAAIEPDLLYPLLRGRDVKKWIAEPSASIIVTHLPEMKLKAISQSEMKLKYLKTYLYLKKFENNLRERAAFRRYFTRKDKYGRVCETGTFYSIFDIGEYSFAQNKVVWREQASSLNAAVITEIDNKPIIPDHKLMLINCKNEKEAFYLCGMLNSKPAHFVAISYAIEIQFDPHILQHICIPIFDSNNKLHISLSSHSEKAHKAAKENDEDAVKKIEEEIDVLAAQIWGLSEEELKEIKLSLEELS